MKVYIVTSGCYSDYHIEGVYSTREMAEEYIRAIKDDYKGINEWEVDVVVDPIEHGYLRWYVRFDGDNIDYINQEDIDLDDPKEEECSYYNYMGSLSFSIYAKDRDHAIKIASEKRFMLLASGIPIEERTGGTWKFEVNND
jgi:hypothetical protein